MGVLTNIDCSFIRGMVENYCSLGKIKPLGNNFQPILSWPVNICIMHVGNYPCVKQDLQRSVIKIVSMLVTLPFSDSMIFLFHGNRWRMLFFFLFISCATCQPSVELWSSWSSKACLNESADRCAAANSWLNLVICKKMNKDCKKCIRQSRKSSIYTWKSKNAHTCSFCKFYLLKFSKQAEKPLFF